MVLASGTEQNCQLYTHMLYMYILYIKTGVTKPRAGPQPLSNWAASKAPLSSASLSPLPYPHGRGVGLSSPELCRTPSPIFPHFR